MVLISKRFMCSSLSVLLIGSLFAGCGNSKKVTESTPDPVKELITLTQMIVKNPETEALTGGDPNKTPFSIELEKRTKVHINYISVAAEDFDTKLSLLIASGEQPDIISMPANYPGGVVKAVEDGVIVKISDYWDKYAPNFKRLATSRPDWEKNIRSDNGDVHSFACFREDKSITTFFGPMIRKDLLDAAGLALPETIDEWHIALTAFKKAGIKNPLTALNWFDGYSGSFSGAFGIVGVSSNLFSGPDHKMHYGPTQSGYKDFLKTMNQWYKEGLLDPDYVTLKDWALLDTKINSGQSAAVSHFISNIDKYTLAIKKVNPKANFVATKYPVLKKGDKPMFGQRDSSLVAKYSISAKSKHIERAIQYLDYGYTQEGQLLFNFGIPGESYNLDASAKPIYTELITATPKNSKGWTIDQSLAMYVPAAKDEATVQLKSYFDQVRIRTPEQRDALNLWTQSQYPAHAPNVSLTEKETKVSAKLADISTYVDEMTAKFIMGTEPIDNFENFVKQCKNMGIDQVVSIYNDALIRFNNRK